MTDDGDEPEVEPESEAPDLEALREENMRLREELDHLSNAEAADAERKRGKQRRRASIALAVVAALLLPPSVMTVWVRNRLLDTNTYLETVEPLATDPAIQDAVANTIAEEVEGAIDLESTVKEVLPSDLAPLASLIAAGGNNLISELSTKAVQSDQFAQIWTAANREAHKTLVLALTGQEGEVLDFSDGKIVLPLDKLVQTVLGGIDDATGLDLESRAPDISGEFVLFESDDLAEIQSLVRFFDMLSWFLPILTLLLLVGAVLVAPDRRLGVRRAGIAVAVPMLLTLGVVALGRDLYLNALTGVVQSTAAAEAAFDIITNFLRMALRAGLAIGIVIGLGAWLVGPSASAEKVRSWGRLALGKIDDHTGERDLGPVPRWVQANRGPLSWAVVALGAIVLVAWRHPDGGVVLGIAAAVAVGVAIVWAIGAAANPEPEGDDATVAPSQPEPEKT
ncbi:MAG: hypothetical protein GY812_11605 [Actinomycetia bacterium]|nr:hypothetical protein [Actinomycetes bacterium]